MSDHHRLRDPNPPASAARNVKDVFRHQGDMHDFRLRYRRVAEKASESGPKGVADVAWRAKHLISDTRNLRLAWDHLAEYGGPAPGPDGFTYTDVVGEAAWRMVRGCRDEIRADRYEPGPERLVRIPKGPGRGYRTLSIPSVFDRMVQRAAVQILQPLLDPLFDDRSFGYRPGRGRERALAEARRRHAGGQRVWVTADIRDAFPSVPVPRLLQVVRKYLPDDWLVDFVGRCLSNAATPGLRQGGPLSPLLLNLYLHHHLDRYWRKQYPGIPLVRVADDILLLCGSRAEAEDAFRALAARLTPAGLRLKESAADAVRDLGAGAHAEWLGYRVEGGKTWPRVFVSARGWEGLVDRLILSGKAPGPAGDVTPVLRAWVGQQGACFKHEDMSAAHQLLATHAERYGSGDPPTRAAVEGWWQRAHARWCKLKKAIAAG